MSDSAPRRIKPLHFAIIDAESGLEIEERQRTQIEHLNAAGEALREAMHTADGTTAPGEHQQHHWSGERMRQAAFQLDLALMLARKAALEG